MLRGRRRRKGAAAGLQRHLQLQQEEAVRREAAKEEEEQRQKKLEESQRAATDSEGEDDVEEEPALLVVGFPCKLFHNTKLYEATRTNALLQAWHDDPSLLVDRFDGRLLLDDQRLFKKKKRFSFTWTPALQEEEAACDAERYRDLRLSNGNVALYEEKLRAVKESRLEDDPFDELSFAYSRGDQRRHRRRKRERNERTEGAAIPFSYDDDTSGKDAEQETGGEATALGEDTDTEAGEVRTGPDDEAEPEPLPLHASMQLTCEHPLPRTRRQLHIIEKTAKFVARGGVQMELLVKTKEQHNPWMRFLQSGHRLHPLYTHLRDLCHRVDYVPSCDRPHEEQGGKQQQQPESEGVVEKESEQGGEAETAAKAVSGADEKSADESGKEDVEEMEQQEEEGTKDGNKQGTQTGAPGEDHDEGRAEGRDKQRAKTTGTVAKDRADDATATVGACGAEQEKREQKDKVHGGDDAESAQGADHGDSAAAVASADAHGAKKEPGGEAGEQIAAATKASGGEEVSREGARTEIPTDEGEQQPPKKRDKEDAAGGTAVASRPTAIGAGTSSRASSTSSKPSVTRSVGGLVSYDTDEESDEDSDEDGEEDMGLLGAHTPKRAKTQHAQQGTPAPVTGSAGAGGCGEAHTPMAPLPYGVPSGVTPQGPLPPPPMAPGAHAYMQAYQDASMQPPPFQHQFSQQQQQPSGGATDEVVVPPPDVKTRVDKLAFYVAKNGEAFERTILQKHRGDPRFGFLQPGHLYHRYYKEVVNDHAAELAKQKAAEPQQQEQKQAHKLGGAEGTDGGSDASGVLRERTREQASTFRSDEKRLARATIGSAATVQAGPQALPPSQSAQQQEQAQHGGEAHEAGDAGAAARRRRRRKRRFDVGPAGAEVSAPTAAVPPAGSSANGADGGERGGQHGVAGAELSAEERKKQERRRKAKEFAYKLHFS